MEITNEQYLLFYEKLWSKFKAHVDQVFILSGDNPATAPVKLWEYWNFQVVSSTKQKLPLTELLFHAKESYFYKLKPKPGRIGQVSIRNNSFVKALEFILEVPQEQLFQGGDWLEKAKELWGNFSTPQKNSHKIEHSFSVIDAPAVDIAHNKILEFYSSLMAFKFEDAWNCMSSNLRNRSPWNNVYENFRTGYTWTSAIQDLAIFNPKDRGCFIDFKVFYNDKVSVYPIKGLAGISDLTIDELSEKINRLAVIRKEIEARGGREFGKTRFKDLFNPLASNLIFYYCGIPSEVVHQTFPRPKVITVERLIDITCIKTEDGWFVNDISHAPVVSIH